MSQLFEDLKRRNIFRVVNFNEKVVKGW